MCICCNVHLRCEGAATCVINRRTVSALYIRGIFISKSSQFHCTLVCAERMGFVTNDLHHGDGQKPFSLSSQISEQIQSYLLHHTRQSIHTERDSKWERGKTCCGLIHQAWQHILSLQYFHSIFHSLLYHPPTPTHPSTHTHKRKRLQVVGRKCLQLTIKAHSVSRLLQFCQSMLQQSWCSIETTKPDSKCCNCTNMRKHFHPTHTPIHTRFTHRYSDVQLPHCWTANISANTCWLPKVACTSVVSFDLPHIPWDRLWNLHVCELGTQISFWCAQIHYMHCMHHSFFLPTSPVFARLRSRSWTADTCQTSPLVVDVT